jgi:hypothetical protein
MNRGAARSAALGISARSAESEQEADGYRFNNAELAEAQAITPFHALEQRYLSAGAA